MSFLKDLSMDKIRNAAEDVYNQAKPKTDLEAKIYEVLSHKNWGASTTLLNEIARESFDYDKFPIITRLMWEAIDGRPAAWRVVFKGLTLCEHLVKHGSERCVDDARYHSHQLRSLEKFNFYEGTVDRGIGVREKAKQIVELLGDDERIRDERNKAKALREKFGGTGDMGGISSGGGGSSGASDRYSGFGNSGGGGYGGDKGVGSSYGGSGSAGANDTHGFSGRYHDKNSVNGGSKSNESSGYGAEPTFASIPDPTKPATKKKTKKKKKKVSAAAATISEKAAAQEVDLFSFDSPEPVATTAPASNDDEFDAFTSARSAPATSAFDNAPAPVTANDDLFGSFSGAQASAPTQAPVDPFAATTTTATTSNMQQTSFNNTPIASQQMNIMQGGFSNGMSAPVHNAEATTNIMSGTKAAFQPSDEPDDFGDFSGPAISTQTESTDPVSKLINLDSLSINRKKEDKTDAPIIYNAAAQHSFMTQKQAPKSNIGNEFAFSGLDGIQKPINLNINSTVHRSAGQPAMNSMSSPSPGMGVNMQGGMMGGMQGTGMMSGGMQAGGMMGGMQGAGMMGTAQNTNMMGGTQGGNMMGAVQGNNIIGGMQGSNMMGGMQGSNMMGGMQGGNMMGGMQGVNMMGGVQGANMMGSMPQQSGMMSGSAMGGVQGANTMAGGMGSMQPSGMMGMQASNMMGGMPNMQSGGMGQPMNQTNMPSKAGNDAGWHGFSS